MVMSVAVEPSFPLIQQIQHEGMILETYRVDKDTVRARILVDGKCVVDEHMTRPHNSLRAIVQCAYDNAFYWDPRIVFQSPDERDAILKRLKEYWETITDRKLNPSASVVKQIDVDGRKIKLARHWHPNRLVVRIYCSFVVTGVPVSVHPGFVMEAEQKYSVACELAANQKPPAEQEVIAALLTQIK
jgi:hypothetical protein